MTVREFAPADLPTVAALFWDTVRRVNRRDYSAEQVAAWAPDLPDLDRWADRLRPLVVRVAEVVGKIVGFASWRADGYFDHLYVHADHQRCGVATALADWVETAMRDTGVTLAFSDVSITALPFFERRGYRVVREQTVVVRGVALTNYRTEKRLDSLEEKKAPG